LEQGVELGCLLTTRSFPSSFFASWIASSARVDERSGGARDYVGGVLGRWDADSTPTATAPRAMSRRWSQPPGLRTRRPARTIALVVQMNFAAGDDRGRKPPCGACRGPRPRAPRHAPIPRDARDARPSGPRAAPSPPSSQPERPDPPAAPAPVLLSPAIRRARDGLSGCRPDDYPERPESLCLAEGTGDAGSGHTGIALRTRDSSPSPSSDRHQPLWRNCG